MKRTGEAVDYLLRALNKTDDKAIERQARFQAGGDLPRPGRGVQGRGAVPSRSSSSTRSRPTRISISGKSYARMNDAVKARAEWRAAFALDNQHYGARLRLLQVGRHGGQGGGPTDGVGQDVRSLFDRPRHRPRHVQHPRARARQGHRALRALGRRHGAGHEEGRRGRDRGQEDALEDPRRHRGHPAAARRRHRGLRGHREDDPLLHREGHRPALVREAPHGHRRAHLHHRGGEARRARLRRAGRAPARST